MRLTSRIARVAHSFDGMQFAAISDGRRCGWNGELTRVVTFGCRVNQADSLAIEGDAWARGAGALPDEADLVVVNTCSVTRRRSGRAPDHPPHCAQQPFGADRCDRVLRDARARRSARPAERDPRRSESTQGRSGPRLGAVTTTRGAIQWTAMDPVARPRAGRRRTDGVHAARQTGCDERCSYCIIPSTRGSGRSRPMA